MVRVPLFVTFYGREGRAQMLEAILVVAGLVMGGVVGWFWATARTKAACAAQATQAESRASAAEGAIAELRKRAGENEADISRLQAALDGERQARVRAETRLTEAASNLQEQKRLLDDAEKALRDTFKALSADALASSNKAFLDLARNSLETMLTDARGDLAKRQEAIDGLVKPLGESLKGFDEHVKALEASRQKAYGSIEEHLKALTSSQQRLQRETGNLVTALRNPQVRGRWGEVGLKRVVELAGMSQHCDFEEQVSVETDGGRLRPDMVVHLPAGREIIVDAKVSLDAYQMTQALLNLMLNSLKFVEKKGRIDVGAFLNENGSRLVLQVEDNGPGIPSANLEKIFDPFFTTRETGTGLGLAIVHKVVENHQGEIDVESPLPAKADGCRFTIRIPVVKETQETGQTGST